jgi:hypothetical protein
MVRAVSKGELPEDARTSGYTVFWKVPGAWLPSDEFRDRSLQLDIISPSFQYNERAGCSLVQVYTQTLAMARKAQRLLADDERN